MNAFLGGNYEQSLDGTLLVLTSPPTRASVRVSPRLFFGPKRKMISRFKDCLRERRIHRLRLELLRAQEGQRVSAWKALQAEINSRSPAQVYRMEKERGLA